MKNDKFKEDKNSLIEVTRVVDQWQDQNGIVHRNVSKSILNQPLNLGSLRYPRHKDIITIKSLKKTPNHFDLSSLFRM